MTQFAIFGAGMAGLLAAAILRDQVKVVVERQPTLPNNHSAVLRFRSSVVSDATGIPFRKVNAMKAIHPWRNPVADMLAYSQKVSGQLQMRSITTASGEVNERYIAPTDFIHQLFRKASCEFVFGEDVTDAGYATSLACERPIIWTGPLFAAAKLFGVLPDDIHIDSTFKAIYGVNVIIKLDRENDAYASLYVPDPMSKIARISITGNEVVAECPYNTKNSIDEGRIAREACEMMGINPLLIKFVEKREQRYSKILPIDDRLRKTLITRLTREHRVYLLGRFATWRPGLLLDDVVNDIRVIQRLATGETSYNYVKKGY